MVQQSCFVSQGLFLLCPLRRKPIYLINTSNHYISTCTRLLANRRSRALSVVGCKYKEVHFEPWINHLLQSIILTRLVHHFKCAFTMPHAFNFTMGKFRQILCKRLWIKENENWEDETLCLVDLKMIAFRWQTKLEGKAKIHKTDG